jgi:ferredoxin
VGTRLSVETKTGRTYTPRAVIIAVGKLVLLDKLAVRDQTGSEPSLAQTIAGSPGAPPVSKENLSRTILEPDGLLRGTPLRYERDLTLGRALFLAVWAAVVVWLYLAKSGVFFGDPLAGATAFLRDPTSPLAVRGSWEEALTFFGWKGLWLYARDLSLGSFYPLLYSAVVLVFGVRAARRWGDGLQRRKYALLIGAQVFLYFLLPELILRPLLGYGYWFGYTLAYPWPLVVSPKTLSAMIDPNRWPPASLSQFVTSGNFYVLWALFISFVVLPVGVLFHGKRFCSWVCGCGALAETLGDSWRHFRPAGAQNRARERQILYSLAIVFLLSLATSAAAVFGTRGSAFWQVGNWAKLGYSVGFDLLAVSIIPVALYPVLGGKLWCRYWCPTAGFMHLVSAFFRKKNLSRTAIVSKKERCIACGHCTRYCEVGIDVRAFALKGKVLDNLTSSCIGCGTCVSVCPTGVLGFGDPRGLATGASKVVPKADKAEPERIGA